MSTVTTRVPDTPPGRPAVGVPVWLEHLTSGETSMLAQASFLVDRRDAHFTCRWSSAPSRTPPTAAASDTARQQCLHGITAN